MSVTGSRIPLQERPPSLLNEGSFIGNDLLLTEQDAFNITGAGVINYLDITNANAIAMDLCTAYLVIDGVTVFSSLLTGAGPTHVGDIVADFAVVYPNGIPFSTSCRAYFLWSGAPATAGEPKFNWEVIEQ